MSQENIYPGLNNTVYEPEPMVGSLRLTLDVDNLDDLAVKWLVHKSYAVVERLVGALYHLGLIAAAGVAGLGIRKLAHTYDYVRERGDLNICQLRYFPDAHSYCSNDRYLSYYGTGEVNRAFNSLESMMRKSGIMFVAAGALIAMSFGARWLKGRISARRASAKAGK